jgi:hypothetical protein
MIGRRWRRVVRWVVLAGAIVPAGAQPAAAQTREVHGENATFFGHGVAMAWAVLQAAREEETRVVLRVAPAGGAYIAVSVEGVDPFTHARRELLGPRSLDRALDVWTRRATFADFPRREIHFYTAADQAARRPSLTVYFAGLPDTTPEFASEAALDAYLSATLATLRGN